MKKLILTCFLGAGIGASVFTAGVPGAWAESPAPATESSSAGKARHFHVRMQLPDENVKPPKVTASGVAAPKVTPNKKYFYETPSSLACVYGLVTQTPGCNALTATSVVSNASSPTSIAIVIAYHNPNIQSDLAAFDTQFGLQAPPTFKVVSASGSVPANDSGWALESSLDVEWSHAMSPNAKLYLVEAASNSFADLFVAVKTASGLVAADGGGVVSMSWGGSEFSTETTYETYFQKTGVTFIASSGDDPGVIYPSTSAWVISAGGTTVSRNPATGDFIGEGTWQYTGGGSSAYIPRPSYQAGLSSVVGAYRGVPDVAAVADPYTGVWVYSGYGAGGWTVVGGTSVAAPAVAGMISHTGVKYTAAHGALTSIYAGTFGNFRDITSGNCGPYAGLTSGVSWDFCTGRGSPLGGTRMMAINGANP